MILTLSRYLDNGVSTIGVLTVDDLMFYTIEDTHRWKKIWGKTRIPAGTYEIKLRNEGNMNQKYSHKFKFHKGMLWLQGVPNFEYIYIHIGNRSEDSNGCILVGSGMLNNNFITGSTVAYIRLYSKVIKTLEKEEQVFINIIDDDK